MDGAPAGVRVPVVEVAAQAYRMVFGQLGLVLELAWLPLLILLAAAIVPDLLLPPSLSTAGATFGFTPADEIEAAFAVVCLNAFAVRWMQMAIFERQRAVPPRLFPRAFGRFLLYTVCIYILAFVLMIAIVGAAALSTKVAKAPPNGLLGAIVAGASVASALLWLLTARLALLFPAAAAATPLGWRAAWRLMRGNCWRLIGCGFLACAPFVATVALMLMFLLSAAQIGSGGAGMTSLGFILLRGVVDTLANFIVVALASTIIVGFYRRILRDQPPALDLP